MNSRALVLAVAAGLATWCSATAIPLPKSGAHTPPDVQDVVFLGDTRPVLVRLHVHIDGKPFLTAWNDFIKYTFQKLDTNGDGVLSKDEAERLSPPQMLAAWSSWMRHTSSITHAPRPSRPQPPAISVHPARSTRPSISHFRIATISASP